MIPDSAALDPAAKGGLYRESSIRALTDAVERRGLDATVGKGLSPGSYRVRYRVTGGGKVAIIIPTRNAVELVEQCVSTIERHTTWPDYEIFVIDNGSTDPLTLEYLQRKTAESDRFTCLPFDRR
ncbi:MAG TPA: glycosyltransferase family A protein, partial [bacterium]|nr:glycosyltransferase family A protein [bacterium]